MEFKMNNQIHQTTRTPSKNRHQHPAVRDYGKFTICNGIILTADNIATAIKIEKFLDNPSPKICARINENFVPYVFKELTLYGEPMELLLNENYKKSRCHGTALAYTLAVDNCDWIYSNLKALGCKAIYANIQDNNDIELGYCYREARYFDSIEPAFNHSYVRTNGYNLMKNNIISPKSIEKGFSIAPSKSYIIDPILNLIMLEKDYNHFFEPEIIESYSSAMLKKDPLWRLLKQQTKIPSKEYTYDEFSKVGIEILISTQLAQTRPSIVEFVATDIVALTEKNNNIKEHWQQFLQDIYCENETNSNEQTREA